MYYFLMCFGSLNIRFVKHRQINKYSYNYST
nr:MAG TPA: hypothetical protein [Bacteriophage sp.]